MFEIVDHVQHMGCEEMDVELIESDDDGVDMGPSKLTLVGCRESLKSIANFIAQDVTPAGSAIRPDHSQLGFRLLSLE